MSNERACQCGQAHGACITEFQYAVKLLCGVVEPAHDPAHNGLTPVAPGQYWTAINIHNPDKCKDARFRWKVVVAKPLGEPLAVPVYQRPRVLGPDLALEIDCRQVMHTLPPPPPPAPKFVKGYVVIESDNPLDVVAVYTTAQGASAPLNGFHTERVEERCVPVCEDLVLPLHTGFARWQTVSPTTGILGPVVPVPPVTPPWAVAPFGSSWVSQYSTDSALPGGTGLGTRTYELCFDLCFGFSVPAPIQIQVLADDSAKLFIRTPGNPLCPLVPPIVGSAGGGTGFQVPTLVTIPPGCLRAGLNCLRVEVTNGPLPHGGPTGFALAGVLHVVRGKCPCSQLPIAIKSPGATASESESDEPSESQSDELSVGG